MRAETPAGADPSLDGTGPDRVRAEAADAEAAAAAAAGRAGVEIRELSHPAATGRASELFSAIWRTAAQSAPVNSDLLRALARSGHYVAGAYDGDTLVGAAM